MGIYLPNIEIPKDTLLIAIGPDGTVDVCRNNELTWLTLKDKAVPVSPHGRLIDADALKAKQQEDADLFINAVSLAEKSRRDEALNAVANIVNAPTIISAEE